MKKTYVYRFSDLMLEAWGLPFIVDKWYVRTPIQKGDMTADILVSALESEGPFNTERAALEWVEGQS